MSIHSDPDVIKVDPDFALASWNDVFMVIWRVNTTVEGARALRRECLGFAAKRPEGIALLTIVEEGAPMPAPESREVIARFLGDASESIRASAVIFEGDGFRAAAVRSVVIGLTMLARQKYPHKVFAAVEDGATWLERELREYFGGSFTADGLCNATTRVRAALTTEGASAATR